MNAQRQSLATSTRIAMSALALSALCACGGGHASTLPAIGSQNRNVGTTPAQSVAFRVAIPHTITSSSHGRQVRYVSAATKSITIGEQPATGGTAVSTTSNCSTSVCTGTLFAPLGMGTFTIGLYDGLNGAGNLLSKGAKTQTIVPFVNTIVAVTFDPVVASLVVNVEPTALELGAPSVTFVQVIAKDAVGNTIVGPGSLTSPISITSSDASGAIALKANKITDIGQSIEVDYNGATIVNPTFTATVPGLSSSTPASLALVANLKSLNGDFTGDIPDSASELDGIPFDDQASPRIDLTLRAIARSPCGNLRSARWQPQSPHESRPFRAKNGAQGSRPRQPLPPASSSRGPLHEVKTSSNGRSMGSFLLGPHCYNRRYPRNAGSARESNDADQIRGFCRGFGSPSEWSAARGPAHRQRPASRMVAAQRAR